MTLNVTRWSPDHCGCTIDYEWDSSVPVEERVHTARRIVKKCPAHSTPDIIDHHDHFDTVLKENQRKNRLHGEIMQQFPELTDLIHNDGTVMASGETNTNAELPKG